MFVVEFADQLFNIQLLAQASMKLADAKLDGCAKPIEPLDALEQPAAKLLLGSLRQGGRRSSPAPRLTIFINDITLLCLAGWPPGRIG
jgi:hypothetical protein